MGTSHTWTDDPVAPLSGICGNTLWSCSESLPPSRLYLNPSLPHIDPLHVASRSLVPCCLPCRVHSQLQAPAKAVTEPEKLPSARRYPSFCLDGISSASLSQQPACFQKLRKRGRSGGNQTFRWRCVIPAWTTATQRWLCKTHPRPFCWCSGCPGDPQRRGYLITARLMISWGGKKRNHRANVQHQM